MWKSGSIPPRMIKIAAERSRFLNDGLLQPGNCAGAMNRWRCDHDRAVASNPDRCRIGQSARSWRVAR
jgi:hypothetical protein